MTMIHRLRGFYRRNFASPPVWLRDPFALDAGSDSLVRWQAQVARRTEALARWERGE